MKVGFVAGAHGHGHGTRLVSGGTRSVVRADDAAVRSGGATMPMGSPERSSMAGASETGRTSTRQSPCYGLSRAAVRRRC